MSNTPNLRTTFYGSTKGIEETSDLLKLKSKHRKYKKSKNSQDGSAPAIIDTPAKADAQA